MKKRLSKLLILSLFGVVLSVSPAFCEDEGTVKLLPPIQTEEQELDSTIEEAINNTEEVKTPHVEDIQEMTPNANDDIKKEVVEGTDNHLKDVVKKFLAAMAGVLISSVLIFLILVGMNKFNLLKNIQKPENEEKTEEIPTSNDENDALKIFFDVTK